MLKKSIALSAALVAAVFAAGCAATAETEEARLEASGVIQVEEIRIASEFQATVSNLLVDVGDSVEAHQPLVMLSSTAVESGVGQAQKALDTAQSELDLVLAEPRPEAVAAKRARVAMAEAERASAYVAWQAALNVLHEPQDLECEILRAEGQAALAAQNARGMTPSGTRRNAKSWSLSCGPRRLLGTLQWLMSRQRTKSSSTCEACGMSPSVSRRSRTWNGASTS